MTVDLEPEEEKEEKKPKKKTTRKSETVYCFVKHPAATTKGFVGYYSQAAGCLLQPGSTVGITREAFEELEEFLEEVPQKG